jgi:hypothetical protein
MTAGNTTTYDIYADCARLNISNNSDAPLHLTFPDRSSITLDANTNETYKIPLPDGLPRNYGFDYEGLYVLPAHIAVPIDIDQLADTTINANAGAVKIYNSSIFELKGIYFMPTGQENWGINLLDTNLVYDTTTTISVAPGNWSIKFIDQFDQIYYMYDEFVTTNHIVNITFSADNQAKS